MTFETLQLAAPLLRALQAEGYDKPTPIQERAIPSILKGQDLLGCAQTGTGKTAAFSLPILQQLMENNQQPLTRGEVRALILSPTRELALQIFESVEAYGRHTRLRHTVVFGGVNIERQKKALQGGVDILVATPGRLLDLLGQRALRLDQVQHFVLDEADRMLDMGFIHDIRRVVAQLPKRRQTLLFSATMPPEIRQLAEGLLYEPVQVSVTPVSSTAEKIEQSVFFVETSQKRQLLLHLLDNRSLQSVLVFTRTKHGANRLAKQLAQAGIRAEAIHGNKSQNARQNALDQFKSGRIRVLVATDIAARGIDVEELSHVVNYDLPNVPETYVHRIGRTGRAGASGVAYSFCAGDEQKFLRDINRLLKAPIPVAAGPDLPPAPVERPERREPVQHREQRGTREQRPATATAGAGTEQRRGGGAGKSRNWGGGRRRG